MGHLLRLLGSLCGLLFISCASNSVGEATQPTPSGNTAGAAIRQQVTVDPPCVADAAAKSVCAARGAGFAYGPQPYIYCSGVAPRPEDEQRAFATIKASPCTCNDLEAIARQRHLCSQIPAAPPRPRADGPETSSGGR